MVVSSAANSKTFTVTTPSDQEIRMTRLFDAPRHLVFEAMTKPEHVKRWWGCLGDGYSVPVCEIDLRVGGRWRFVNRHPKGEAAFHGEYREITPPSRAGLHRDLRGVPRHRLGRHLRVRRRERQDAPDGDRQLSVEGCARHGHRVRHVEGRGHQLRPARGPAGRAAAFLTNPRSGGPGQSMARAALHVGSKGIYGGE